MCQLPTLQTSHYRWLVWRLRYGDERMLRYAFGWGPARLRRFRYGAFYWRLAPDRSGLFARFRRAFAEALRTEAFLHLRVE